MPQYPRGSDRATMPTERAALVAFFLEALDQCGLRGTAADGLLQPSHPFRGLITAALNQAASMRHLALSELPPFPLDVTVSLPDLAHACAVPAFETHNATLFTDEAIPPTMGYSLAAFPSGMTGYEVYEQLDGYGLRAAGLREALCLLRIQPCLPPRTRRLLAYGSSHAVSRVTHVCLERRADGWRIRPHQERQRLHPGTDWVVAASVALPR